MGTSTIQAARADHVPIAKELSVARIALTVIFFANGFGLSSWFPRIPDVRNRLDLSDGVLGLALLCPAIGAMLAMPLTGWLIGRLGSRRVTTLTALAYCLALPLPALSPSLAVLAVALFLIGVGNGALDVSMNAQGVAIEGRYGRPILASFHAAFSFGGLAGAVVAGFVAQLGVAVGLHLVLVAAVLALVVWVATRRLLPTPVGRGAGSDHHGPAFVRPSGRLALIGAVAFCCLVGEGAVADWSALYLSGPLAAGAGLAAAGYAAFSLMMAFGRLFGDRFAAAWGPVAVARRGGLLTAVGLAVALAIDHPLAAIAGFAAVGAGLANIVPVAFSAGGRVRGVPAATGIAAVSTAGYAGFLAGPPVIGVVSEAVGLRAALVLVAVMAVVIVRLAGSLSPEPVSQTVA